MISLENDLIGKLSSKGVLAYVAVSLADGMEATTAALAGLVKAQTGAMREGLVELAVEAPERLSKAKNKWRCGVVRAGEGVLLQNLESSRYKDFVDDLKKCWDYMNQNLQFSMGGKDGIQIRQFLRDYPQWTQEDWLIALRNRAISVVRYRHASRSQPIWVWVGRLSDYSAGPLNEYNKPVEGSGKNGQAIATEDGNRAARESVLSSR